jgi:hypothetical protein
LGFNNSLFIDIYAFYFFWLINLTYRSLYIVTEIVWRLMISRHLSFLFNGRLRLHLGLLERIYLVFVNPLGLIRMLLFLKFVSLIATTTSHKFRIILHQLTLTRVNIILRFLTLILKSAILSRTINNFLVCFSIILFVSILL